VGESREIFLIVFLIVFRDLDLTFYLAFSSKFYEDLMSYGVYRGLTVFENRLQKVYSVCFLPAGLSG
jgi:hypothetical protein